MNYNYVDIIHKKNSWFLAEDQAPASKRAKTESSEVASETKPDVDQCAVVISDALATFLGTEQKEMLQSEALKRIWDYIKENHLEVSLASVSNLSSEHFY